MLFSSKSIYQGFMRQGLPSYIARLVTNPTCNADPGSWVGKVSWRRDRLPTPVFLGFPGGSAGKEVKIAQQLSLCDPMDYTVHGILRARILKLVAFPFSMGSSQPRDRTPVLGSFFLGGGGWISFHQPKPDVIWFQALAYPSLTCFYQRWFIYDSR